MITVNMIKYEHNYKKADTCIKFQDSLDEAFGNTQILTEMNLQNLLDR